MVRNAFAKDRGYPMVDIKLLLPSGVFLSYLALPFDPYTYCPDVNLVCGSKHKNKHPPSKCLWRSSYHHRRYRNAASITARTLEYPEKERKPSRCPSTVP